MKNIPLVLIVLMPDSLFAVLWYRKPKVKEI